ncbi:MAG: O-antigen ligase family protein [Candidatus Berkelbacteria bacterium]
MNYLMAIVALLLPTYLIRFNILGIPTTLLEVLIYICVIFGLFNLKKARKIAWQYWLPAVLMLLAALISSLISPEKMAALGQFKAFFLDPILVFVLILTFLKEDDFLLILNGLMGSSLIVSFYSIYQKITGQLTVDGRIVGIFGYSPNYPALFLGPIIGLIVAHNLELMTKRVESRHKTIKLIIGWLAVIAGFIAIYLSASRGVLLALLGGLGFYLIMHFWSVIREKLFLKIGLGILILVVAFVSWSVFKPNFALSPAAGSRVTSSNNIRWQIWQTSLELGRKHPILGLGLANYQNEFNKLTKDRVNFPEYITPWALSSHNVFLMFWLSTGLLGFASFIWVLIVVFQKGCQEFKNSHAIEIMTATIILLLQGLIDTPYFKNDLSLIFWFLVGSMLLLITSKTKKIESSQS